MDYPTLPIGFHWAPLGWSRSVVSVFRTRSLGETRPLGMAKGGDRGGEERAARMDWEELDYKEERMVSISISAVARGSNSGLGPT